MVTEERKKERITTTSLRLPTRGVDKWRIFRFLRLSRPRAPLQKFSLNTENNDLNQMALGHSGQFSGIYHDFQVDEMVYELEFLSVY